MNEPAAGPAVLDVDDHDWLGQADWIIGGEAARAARKQGLYAGYVLVLFAAVYGFPLIQAIFRTTDQAVLRDQVTSPAGVAVLAAAVIAVLAAALWAGRIRGPVVPPLPWIDLVLSAPIDRALAVRRWWRFAEVGSAFVGAVLGLVLGSGLAFAKVTSPLAIGVATLLGVVLGLVAARLWLWGQVRSWPTTGGVRWRAGDSLRALHAESLRAHSANTSTLAGSALTGNLRTARLAFARPIRRARGSRLRPGRPFTVLVRRDALGMRRQPAALLAGASVVVLGAVVLMWGLTQPAAPAFALALGMLPLYLGFGSWAEGLRLQADNIGTPSLLGVLPRAEAVAHLVIPVALTTAVLTATGAVAAVLGGALAVPVVSVVTAGVLIVALLCGGHLLAAFRGTPPDTSGPQGMVLWYLRPGAIVVVLGAFVGYTQREGLSGGAVVTAAAVAAVVAWGFGSVRRLTHLHRD